MTGAGVEDLVLGHLLDARRRGRGGASEGGGRLGSARQRHSRGLLRNAGAPRSWQSVVKRIAGGSARTPQELKRLLDYVTREDGVESSWCNLAGYPREFDPAKTARVAQGWSSTWRGAPKRGHADHIVLSFPRGVDPLHAERIAREWGEAVFGSGDHGDVWRYVAALHRDTDHVHAHFVVDKHGIEQGRFLSICRHAALNFDVMRELHAEIAQEHGLNIVATSRLSRGLIEPPARDSAQRMAAHANGDTTPTAPPPLSDAERARRLALLQDYARDYEELGRIAAIAAGAEERVGSGAGFLTRLAEALAASAEALRQGLPMMPDLSLHAEGDAAARLDTARADMILAAEEAWGAIRAMSPSAERVELERSFAEQARTALPLMPGHPLLTEHARVLTAAEDPYSHPMLVSLARLEAGTAEVGADLLATLTHAREEIGERLSAIFALRADDLRSAGTSIEEMVARVTAPERNAGQIAAWRDQPTAEAKVLWLEAERDLHLGIHDALRGLNVAPALAEALARDQLLTAERHLRLSQVPAVEAIVDRMQEVLRPEDLDRVRSGDLAPLAAQIRDPALRSAVAHELKNEGDISQDGTVARWADLARNQARAAELGQGHRSPERELGHEL